ncbi:hypothetical protein ANCCAN_22998 [Ancylostoma caninum]|uniref:PABS domain-containing protein n=1 Tax=Ancylostoma caninum TaxID=29170 RepID=A0A368FG62_ANCCA|nr:hypothetical protein ANCCAN_22998 [Ancylostoma caninum]
MKKIAEKWYDFKESDLHRIVVEDGIKYAKQASARGEKFDAILLDLCTNERRALLCPIEEFLKNEALHNLAAILVDTGAVIVNIITGSEFREQGPKEAKRASDFPLSERFSTPVVLRFTLLGLARARKPSSPLAPVRRSSESVLRNAREQGCTSPHGAGPMGSLFWYEKRARAETKTGRGWDQK